MRNENVFLTHVMYFFNTFFSYESNALDRLNIIKIFVSYTYWLCL